MKNIIAISFLLSVACSCKEYHFSKTYGYLPDRKLETTYYGDHKNGYKASEFLGITLSSGGGTSFDSIVKFYHKKPYQGPTITTFKSYVFRYGPIGEKVDYFYITDYVNGREIGNRYFSYKQDSLLEFGYDYPSKRLNIQFDKSGKPMNYQLFVANLKIDTIYNGLNSIPIQVDSLKNELLKANWFNQHFEMTYLDSINGLSPLIETKPTKK